MSKIVLLGATGYAGGLALESLLRAGARPVVAGSRRPKVAALAARHGGLDHAVADAGDEDSVRALVEAGDVLVTTVGPFERLGRVVARAAAVQGAHYVDSTGEVGFVRHLVDEVDGIARRTGSVMLPAFGNDYVPGLLAGALAARAAGERGTPSALDVGYLVRGTLEGGRGLSQGTRRTLLEELGRPTLVWAGGGLREERVASRTALFLVDGAPRRAVLASGTEVLFLPRRFSGLQQVRVYNGWFPHLARPSQAVSAVAALAERTSAGRRLAEFASGRLAGPPGGPDAARRARSQVVAAARASDAHGRTLATTTLAGPNAYDLTGDLMAWAATSLARGEGRGSGVLDALEAFGVEESLAAARAMGLVEA